jgi:predicted house-cleaning noncanonical NTP pyrophosphatase (MazG superfamily)
MRMDYRKLVRDRVPEIIHRNGYTCEIATMTDEEYHQALREKLVEEAGEAAGADADHLVIELADLFEVMDALMVSHGITSEMVQVEQERRRIERGGFARRIRLLWTERAGT